MSFADIAALTIHDVKNSLALLAGQAEARGDIAMLRCTIEASEKLTRLLIFYKSQENILCLAVDAHAPADLVIDLAEGIRGMGDIVVNTQIGAAPTLWFYDQTLVRMVLSNAMHNALRYASSQITVSVIEHDDHLELSVHDDGPGYPANVLADTGASVPSTDSGTGLGLYLAQQVAFLHENAGQHGGIELVNAHGALFILRLPR